MRYVHRSYVKDQYPTLVQNNRLRASDLVYLRDEASRFGYKPLISILLPFYEPKRGWLEWTLDSMLSQVSPRNPCKDASLATSIWVNA